MQSQHIVSVAIPQYSITDDDVVFYQVTATTPVSSFTCSKRYNQFETLHQAILHSLVDGDDTKLTPGAILPPKRPKAIIKHTEPNFIEDRRLLLQHYLKKLLSQSIIANSNIFTGFFQTDVLPSVVPVRTESINFWAAPDDAEVTWIAVTGTRSAEDHALYQIDCVNSRRRRSFSQWTVFKRFNQAYEMDAAIRETYAHDPYLISTFPRLPTKSVKGLINHQSKHFIEHRRVLLDAYLKKAIQITEMARHPAFFKFAGIKSDT